MGAHNFTIDTLDFNYIGVYELQLKVRYSGAVYHYVNYSTLDFTVRVYDRCMEDPILMSSKVFDTDLITCYIYNPVEKFELKTFEIKSVFKNECPPYEIEIRDNNPGL